MLFQAIAGYTLRKYEKAPAKRSQHANTTCRNIVGRNMLRAFGHRVATCCDMLGVVGSSLKLVKFERTTPNTGVATGRNKVAKRTQHVAPNNVATCCVGMLRSFGRGLSFHSTRSDARVRFDSGATFVDQSQFFAMHSNQ